jgi:phosphoribosylaminoimidazolecarboxamide formyltransferase/IMP cyclohydrolase
MRRAVLLSVSDRTGLAPLARHFSKNGFVLLTTGGTGKALTDEGIEYLPIGEYTGQREILDGRVKTLHPKIHGGILARRGTEAHMAELEASEILSIDVVVVNLYPFVGGLAAGKSYPEMVELIDVGGPSMLRAAAKNHTDVLVVSNPADYEEVMALPIPASGALGDQALRRKYAGKVFTLLSGYDGAIASYLNGEQKLSASLTLPLVLGQSLRYGENPHQSAGFYRTAGKIGREWECHHGKELSYNNILDVDAGVALLRTMASSDGAAFVAILKHLNPCGAAVRPRQEDALAAAKRGDPRSHFGGIICFSTPVEKASAEMVREDFAEIVIAPGYSEEAKQILATSKNLRIVTVDISASTAAARLQIRSALDGFLVQEEDRVSTAINTSACRTERVCSFQEQSDLRFAWGLAAHVKSNAIVIVKNGVLIGAGAGQMSRIDSVELAIQKARLHGHDLQGAVCASDAFFPFPDSVETLAAAGIKAIVAPSGAKRDDEVVKIANSLGITMIFATERHFRH